MHKRNSTFFNLKVANIDPGIQYEAFLDYKGDSNKLLLGMKTFEFESLAEPNKYNKYNMRKLYWDEIDAPA